MVRILLLIAAYQWKDAAETLQNARDNAAEPAGVSFGLSLTVEPTDEEQAQMHSLGTVTYLAPGTDPWQDMELLWQGENYVLIGRSSMRFQKGWDRTLLRSLSWCRRESGAHCALTGYLPRRVDPVDAVYPVAASRIDRRGRLHFQRGTPLRYARHPQRSAFLHPHFCFAPASFFRLMRTAEAPRFLDACLNKWELYTLHRPVIRLEWEPEIQLEPIDVSMCPLIEGIGRFETRFGVKFAERKLSAMAKCGLFSPDLSFDSRVPMMVRMQEALRSLDNRVSPVSPMCVTAWLTLQGNTLDETKLQCFRRLSSMEKLPLLCFIDNESAHRIMFSHQELQEYRQRYGLDVPREAILSDQQTYIKLSKPFMLAQSREATLRYSHYIWLDFDYQRYPIYHRAALDWNTVCTDKIVMAVVDDRLDTSMIVVPQEMLEPLCAVISTNCREEWFAGYSLPREQDMWRKVIHLHPDWFTLLTLPGQRELLSLTMPLRGEEYHTKA